MLSLCLTLELFPVVLCTPADLLLKATFYGPLCPLLSRHNFYFMFSFVSHLCENCQVLDDHSAREKRTGRLVEDNCQ